MRRLALISVVLLVAGGLFIFGCAQTTETTTTTTVASTTTTTTTGSTTSTTTSTTTTTTSTSTTTSTTTTSTTSTSTTSTSTTTTTYSYPTATLLHWGFDFATGAATDESGKYDGEIINWNPDYVTTSVEGITYPSYSDYVWWRGAYPLDMIPHQKHMGTAELSSITAVPGTWESGTQIMPLLAGHSYVVMCTPEGYAKLYVTHAGTLDAWHADVRYYFTTEATFNK